jgi:hypothetical protein
MDRFQEGERVHRVGRDQDGTIVVRDASPGGSVPVTAPETYTVKWDHRHSLESLVDVDELEPL